MSNINIKIDVTKVLKEHLFVGKNGAKYLDITLWENRDGVDSYGNTHMAVQALPKELREAGEKGPILGNGKVFGQAAPRQQAKQADKPAAQNSPPDEDDDIPF